MRNKILIIAVPLLLASLVVSLVWWSHRPSMADTAVPTAQVTPGVANPADIAVPPVAIIPSPAGQASPGGVVRTTNNPPPIAPRTGTTLVAPVPGANSLPLTTPAAVNSQLPGNEEGMIELDKARRMIRDYHTLMGENPVGTNAEIMKALMGHNPHQATLGPIEGMKLNDKGELIDQWNTPYFFHQLSGNHMEIHSAGPDKVMGTKDDLILH